MRSRLVLAASLLLPALPALAQRPTVTVAPAHPAPGALVRLTIHDYAAPNNVTVALRGRMAGEPLHFRAMGSLGLSALAAVPTDASDSLVAEVYADRANGASDTIRTVIRVPHHKPPEPTAARPRGASRLRVDARFSRPADSALTARIADENARARAVGRASHETPPLWDAPFTRPRASRITSGFGSGRLFNGRVGSTHGGVDFAGKKGEPVRAANRGVVALVDTFYLAGRVVYVDHGGGIVTGYFHLSEALVQPGDTVARGQLIGRVGASGRVTGPHLHWAARYGAVSFDPIGLVTLTGGSVARPRSRAATTAKRAPAKKPQRHTTSPRKR